MGLYRLLGRNLGRGLFLPAHGRGAALPDQLRILLKKKAGIWDLPELAEIGGPLLEKGEIAKCQNELAESIGASRAWFGVNGATGLLQAALLAIARPGQAVLMPRNVHKSIINACVLGDLIPVIFDIPFSVDLGHHLPPDGIWLEKVLDELGDKQIQIAAAVFVHPTYQGYAEAIRPLISQIHQMKLPVLVDEAHGSHFAINTESDLPESSLTAGADLIVHSLHKSSTGLVQTAVLWLQGELVDPCCVERALGLLQTTSPSALLLASCDASLSEWRTSKGQKKLTRQLDFAKDLHKKLTKDGLPLIENQDPLRLVLNSGSKGINGFDADSWFINHGLIAELPEPATLTFCLGFAQQKGLSFKMNNAWDSLLAASEELQPLQSFDRPPNSLVAIPRMDCGMALRAKSHTVPLDEALGLTAAELVCPYPPGIPFVVPGEEFDQERINWLVSQKRFWLDHIPANLLVVS